MFTSTSSGKIPGAFAPGIFPEEVISFPIKKSNCGVYFSYNNPCRKSQTLDFSVAGFIHACIERHLCKISIMYSTHHSRWERESSRFLLWLS